MNRIVHISLKVDDVKRTGDFYEQVFGFQDAETRKTRDHLSRHMTDGQIDFTLMQYDQGTRSKESGYRANLRRTPCNNAARASTISRSRCQTSRRRHARSRRAAARS